MPTIVDHRGQPISSTGFAEPQTAKLGWIQRELQAHPSRNLRPAKLARILEDAEHGDVMSQLELYEDMTEKDGHLFAELSKRQRALLTVDWDIVPPVNPSTEEEKAAEELKERLESIDDLEDVFLGAAAAIGPAFSCQEIEWQRIGSDWMPGKVTFRPHTWFTLDREARDTILLRTQGTTGEPLNPFGWITHVHRAKPGYLARAGLMRQLVWPYLFKTFATADLAEFLEIYGMPMRVGSYPANATKEEKETLLRAVTRLGHDAAGIIPEGMKLDFQEAADGKPDAFMAMVDLMERTESKVILGATLTSQADGKTSTNALGTIHNDVRLDILASDARQVAGTLSRDLLYPIGMLNGLVKDPARRPRLRFDVQEEEDFKTMAETMKTVVDMGMRIPRDWAYEQLRIPKPAEGEDVLEAKPAPVVAPGQLPGQIPAKPRLAAVPDAQKLRAALARLLQPAEAAPSFPDQAAVDAALAALDPAELQRQMESVLAPVLELIASAASIDEVKVKLSARYPAMDSTRLETMLERALFVTDLWGAMTADASAG